MGLPYGLGTPYADGPDFVRSALKHNRANMFDVISDDYNFSAVFWESVCFNGAVMMPNAKRHMDEARRRKVVCALSDREHESREWGLMAGWFTKNFGGQEGETNE